MSTLITLRIGTEERKIDDIDESWVNQRINSHRAVCVQVRIQNCELNLLLSTPTCRAGGGGCRPPNRREREILELWEKLGMNRSDFSGGKVVAFLKQLRRLV